MEQRRNQTYQDYFRYREFATRETNRAPPGWTHSILKQAKRGAASLYGFTGGSYLKLMVADRVVDYAVAKAHGVYTSSTRYPVEHDRIKAVIERIVRFDSHRTKENFLRTILESYLSAKSGYFRSNSSHALISALASPRGTWDSKIADTLAYLEKRPTIAKFSQLYQNNGKRLFNTIILAAESGHAEE